MIESQSDDPVVHALCIGIARKCLWVIHAILREEERGDAVNEFYRVAREEIEQANMLGVRHVGTR